MEKIEHFYKNIEGWFTFPHLYSKAVESSIGDSHFVEVGCWKGQSSAYMAVEIINSGKKIKFDVVDTFKGSIEHIDENSPAFEPILKSEGTIRGVFEENIKPVKSNINILEMASQEASLLYEDTSLDFVFIDAAHDYESVRDDISSWVPKISVNGILAGHDIFLPSVQKAVQEFAAKELRGVLTMEDCWIIRF